ncbi:MAG: hypothetical protein ACM3IJ_02670 [Candidatus Levyibacteriota bacterium]
MSIIIETANRGHVGDFGFSAVYVNRLGMGELPPMPRVEFCGYATTTLLQSIPYATPEQINRIRREIDSCGNMLKSKNNGTIPLLDDALPLEKPTDYPNNPFILDRQTRTICIGETYTGIDIGAFGSYVLQVLGGGFYGWLPGATPPEAIQSFRIIKGFV